jgi:two-component system phosphate regulon response regulator PhoB
MKKVLIIEDYYALADIESLLCTMEGYEVKVAKSGDEGLAAFVEFQPDLVLLDLMLPGDLSGTQVLERIRSDHGSDPKVLVVSALVNASTAPKLEQRADAREALQDQGTRFAHPVDARPVRSSTLGGRCEQNHRRHLVAGQSRSASRRHLVLADVAARTSSRSSRRVPARSAC